MPSSYVVGSHLEHFIGDQFSGGRYASPSEVLRDALRLLAFEGTGALDLTVVLARALKLCFKDLNRNTATNPPWRLSLNGGCFVSAG
jgi:putative addiction module CopG family antidote